MNYRSIEDLNQLITSKLYILPHDFDLIVGIPRSGMFPASLIALYMNKNLSDLESFLNGHIYKAGERGEYIDSKSYHKVLVVDDSIASGAAIMECKEKLEPIKSEYDIYYCAAYVSPGKERYVDYAFEILALPRLFQWNVMSHSILRKTCFDIDGVLCADPTKEQNDDGEKYLDFIKNAKPLFIPGTEIGTLVTSRLEKYRPQTEEWLRNHGIKYNKLVMLDLPSSSKRKKANNHAIHKAKEYKSSFYNLFIESSLNQAISINQITGKPVLCAENFKMIYDSVSILYSLKSGESMPFLRNTALRLRNFLKKLRKR